MGDFIFFLFYCRAMLRPKYIFFHKIDYLYTLNIGIDDSIINVQYMCVRLKFMCAWRRMFTKMFFSEGSLMNVNELMNCLVIVSVGEGGKESIVRPSSCDT